MLTGKLILAALVAFTAIFASQVEASRHRRHRSSSRRTKRYDSREGRGRRSGRGHRSSRRYEWRDLVIDRCANDNEGVLILGLDEMTSRLKDNAMWIYEKEENTRFTWAINGKDLADPAEKRRLRDNVEFLQAAIKDSSVVVLPWRAELNEYTTDKAVEYYHRSADAIADVIGVKPLVAYVPDAHLYAPLVEALDYEGFFVLGSLLQAGDEEKALRRKNFISIMRPGDENRNPIRSLLKHAHGAYIDIVKLSQCIGENVAIYAQLEAEEEEPVADDEE